jgi:hypothetical protein
MKHKIIRLKIKAYEVTYSKCTSITHLWIYRNTEAKIITTLDPFNPFNFKLKLKGDIRGLK